MYIRNPLVVSCCLRLITVKILQTEIRSCRQTSPKLTFPTPAPTGKLEVVTLEILAMLAAATKLPLCLAAELPSYAKLGGRFYPRKFSTRRIHPQPVLQLPLGCTSKGLSLSLSLPFPPPALLQQGTFFECHLLLKTRFYSSDHNMYQVTNATPNFSTQQPSPSLKI